MSAPKQPRLCDPDEEIPGLIEVLHRAESRLEELTAGEVDAVTSRDGRVLLLRRSQDRLRQSEASRQSAILNALPVNVALLNSQGRIVSVNEAWRRYARENGLQTPGAGVGANYVEICDRARGSDGSEARDVARGIRSVLSGEVRHFSREYPCHTSTKRSWWRLMVAPLIGDRPNGAVVLHLDVSAESERRRAEQELRELDRRVSDMLGKMQLLSVMLDDQARITYCNDYFLRLTGWQRDEVIGRDWFEMFQPLQMSELRPVFRGFLANPPESWHRENVIVTRSGGSRTIRWNISVLRSGAEDVVGTASIGEDITEQIEQRKRLS
jgi:PAS domain S-box-containing protein